MRGLVLCACVAVVGFAPEAKAQSEITVQERSQIDALLAKLNCRVKDEDIRKRDDEFVLDDVFCADGRFDIRLNSDFEVVGKIAQ